MLRRLRGAVEQQRGFEVRRSARRRRLLLLSVLLAVWCGAAEGLCVFWADCFDIPTSLVGKALRLCLSGMAAVVLTVLMFRAAVLLAAGWWHPGSERRRIGPSYDGEVVASLILAIALGGGSLILDREFGISYRDALGWTVMLLSVALASLAAVALSYRTLAGWRRPVVDDMPAGLREAHHDGASSP